VTPQAFGEFLRRRREKRKVTLDTIARATNVRAALFESLERGDCSRWPGGIYNRGYVRSYALAVGLDPDDTVERFCECFPDPLRMTPAEARPAEPAEAPPGRWTRWRIAVAASWRSLSAARR
jgi:cytoskeletal protein RodZ